MNQQCALETEGTEKGAQKGRTYLKTTKLHETASPRFITAFAYLRTCTHTHAHIHHTIRIWLKTFREAKNFPHVCSAVNDDDDAVNG